MTQPPHSNAGHFEGPEPVHSVDETARIYDHSKAPTHAPAHTVEDPSTNVTVYGIGINEWDRLFKMVQEIRGMVQAIHERLDLDTTPDAEER